MKKENSFYNQVVSSNMEQSSVCAIAASAGLSQSLIAGITKLSERGLDFREFQIRFRVRWKDG